MARSFALAFDAASWNQSADAVAARVKPWATGALETLLGAPAQGGLPASFVAQRLVTSAQVLSVALDPVSPTHDLALVTVRLSTRSVMPGIATTRPATASRILPLSLTYQAGGWAVGAVPGLVP